MSEHESALSSHRHSESVPAPSYHPAINHWMTHERQHGTRPTLVLGGNGKTGRRVVERLTARGLPARREQQRGTDRNSEPRVARSDTRRRRWAPLSAPEQARANSGSGLSLLVPCDSASDAEADGCSSPRRAGAANGRVPRAAARRAHEARAGGAHRVRVVGWISRRPSVARRVWAASARVRRAARGSGAGGRVVRAGSWGRAWRGRV